MQVLEPTQFLVANRKIDSLSSRLVTATHICLKWKVGCVVTYKRATSFRRTSLLHYNFALDVAREHFTFALLIIFILCCHLSQYMNISTSSFR